MLSMFNNRSISRVLLGIAALIFLLYFVERISASARVSVDVITVPDLVMFPLLLFMSFLVGASFIIEAQFVGN
mgnify:CR=1 FL=1